MKDESFYPYSELSNLIFYENDIMNQWLDFQKVKGFSTTMLLFFLHVYLFQYFSFWKTKEKYFLVNCYCPIQTKFVISKRLNWTFLIR